MAGQGPIPDKPPRQRNISARSLALSLAGPESAYPVYRLPLVDRYERPRHNPFTPGVFAIDPSTPPAGAVTVEYPDFRFTASFGESPLVWTVVSGSLPSGLVLQPDGRITGTPLDASGSPYAFTVRATDDGGQTDDLATSISVIARVEIIAPLEQSAFPLGIVGEVYPTQTFAASGGTGPYTWEIVEGHLHDGLTFTAGVIDGTPTNSLNRGPIRVQVTDANGFTDSIVREVRVREPTPVPEVPPPTGVTITRDLEVGSSGTGNFGFDDRVRSAGGFGFVRSNTIQGFEIQTIYNNTSGSTLLSIYDEDLLTGETDPEVLFTSITFAGNTFAAADATFLPDTIAGQVLWLWSGTGDILSAENGNIIELAFNGTQGTPTGTATARSFYALDWRAAADAERVTFVNTKDRLGTPYDGDFTQLIARDHIPTETYFGWDRINETGGEAQINAPSGSADGQPQLAARVYHNPVTIATAEHPFDFSAAVKSTDNQDGFTFDGLRVTYQVFVGGTQVDDDLIINATLILRDRAGIAADVILTPYQTANGALDNYYGGKIHEHSQGTVSGEIVLFPAAGSDLDGHTGWDFVNDWYPVLQVVWQNPTGAAADDGLYTWVYNVGFELYREG